MNSQIEFTLSNDNPNVINAINELMLAEFGEQVDIQTQSTEQSPDTHRDIGTVVGVITVVVKVVKTITVFINCLTAIKKFQQTLEQEKSKTSVSLNIKGKPPISLEDKSADEIVEIIENVKKELKSEQTDID